MAQDTEWARDGKTQDSGSAASGLSSLDDDTDDFGRMILQQARDQRRLDAVMNRNTQAFSKARRNPRITAALDQFNGGLEAGSNSSGASDPGIAYNDASITHPPLNIPREWGRKARHNSQWLRKLGTEEYRHIGPPITEHINPEHGKMQRRTDYVDWAAIADRPLQSIEADPPVTARKRYVIGQTEAPPISNNSIERIGRLEAEHELTAGSVMESTPVFRQRSEYVRDEERLQRRADRLGRIGERDTPQSIKDRLEARLSRITGQPGSRRRRESPDQKLTDKENIHRHEEPRHFKHEHEIHFDVHESNDARTSSLYTRDREMRQQTNRQSSAQAPEVVPEIFINGTNSDSAILETPRVPTALESKTPKVMGAWIETPYAAKRDGAPPPPPKDEEPKPVSANLSAELAEKPSSNTTGQALPVASPPRATSALHSLLHPVRSSPKKELNIGDETLASLEGILDPTGTLTELSGALDLDELRSELKKLHSTGSPLSKEETKRRNELLTLEAVGNSLAAAKRSKKQPGRLERQVDNLVNPADISSTTPHICTVCRHGVLGAISSEIKALFIQPLHHNKYWFSRLTWLGFFLLSSLAWYIAEASACSMYCRPRYAYSMKGAGIIANAPEWPFVIPTLLYRRVAWLFAPLIWLLSPVASAVWSYLSIPFEAEPSAPPSYGVGVAGVWPTPVAHASYWGSAGDGSGRGSRGGGEDETMDADSVVATPGPGGFAKLWSWVAGPAESAVAVVREQAAMAEGEFWADIDGKEYDYPRWRMEEDDDVKIVDTRGLWEEIVD